MSPSLHDLGVSAHLHLNGHELAVNCKHSSVKWALSHTSPIYCRYLHGGQVGIKLYCLLADAHVSKQLASQWDG